jgi:glyoxylase-like metal-dependent hydrolase (beta-lactamase superfamily II)
LIDAGYGPFTTEFPPESPAIMSMRGGGLLDNLRRLGRDPENIQAIALTHLHVEHIGWAWHPAPGEGQATFPNASIIVTEPEWPHRSPKFWVTDAMLDALAPSFRTVTDNQEIFPGVRVLLLPGHTPGHAAYTIVSGDNSLIAFGDIMHSPVQVTHPDWIAAGEPDPAGSARSRQEILRELSAHNTIGFGIHFADVAFGTVNRGESGLEWHPLPHASPSPQSRGNS